MVKIEGILRERDYTFTHEKKGLTILHWQPFESQEAHGFKVSPKRLCDEESGYRRTRDPDNISPLESGIH